MKRKRLGEVLHERGHVSVDDLNRALQEQRGKVSHLGEILLQKGTVSKDELIKALGEVTTVPYVDCTTVAVPKEVLALLPANMARRCNALPISLEDNRLVVAMAEPQNLQILDELRFKTGRQIVPRLGFHGELRAAIAKHYGSDTTASPATPGIARTDAFHDDTEAMEFISSSEQQRNIEAMREMQAELLQKSKT